MQLRRFLLDLAALALILVAPFAILLSFHGYSYSTPEVLLISTSALAAAAVLALLLGFAGEIVRAVVFAALIALFIDIQVSLPPWSSVIVTAGFLAAVAILTAVLWVLREHATAILCVIFVTLIGLTLARGPGSHHIVSEQTAAPGRGDAVAPLLIHLLLDEHIGVEGLPPEIPAARALRAELIRVLHLPGLPAVRRGVQPIRQHLQFDRQSAELRCARSQSPIYHARFG